MEEMAKGTAHPLLKHSTLTRNHRVQVLHTGFNQRKSDTYREIQTLESKLAMYQIMHDPARYEQHLERSAK